MDKANVKILLVDDRLGVRKSFIKLLNQAGYETISQAHDEDTFNEAIKEKPDLVIMDCDIDYNGQGLDFTRTIKKEFPGVKVIGQSGRGNYKEFDYAGADDYFDKTGLLQDDYEGLDYKIQNALKES